MKHLILMYSIFLGLASLTACTKMEPEEIAAREQREKHAPVVASNQHGYDVQKVCVDGVSYLLFDSKAIIAQISIEGKPVKCEFPNVKAE